MGSPWQITFKKISVKYKSITIGNTSGRAVRDFAIATVCGKNCRLNPYCEPYSRILKIYPEKIIQTVTTPKNMKINFILITFLSKVASGIDKPTTAIINARDVPKGIPPFTNPINRGTDEQEQNGVIAPKKEAIKYSSPYILCLDRKFFMRSIRK